MIKKHEEDVKDLLVELEEYIVSIDKDNLDQVGVNHPEEMIKYDLKEVNDNNGKCYLAIENNKVIGLIMGFVCKYEERDYLDYKCPKKGVISELIVSNKVRSKGVDKKLIKEVESYFKNERCEYINVEVFTYNDNAINFYNKKTLSSSTEKNIVKLCNTYFPGKPVYFNSSCAISHMLNRSNIALLNLFDSNICKKSVCYNKYRYKCQKYQFHSTV